MGRQIKSLHLGSRDTLAGLVDGLMAAGRDLQARGRGGGTQRGQHRLPGSQGVARPIQTDGPEQAIVNAGEEVALAQT